MYLDTNNYNVAYHNDKQFPGARLRVRLLSITKFHPPFWLQVYGHNKNVFSFYQDIRYWMTSR